MNERRCYRCAFGQMMIGRVLRDLAAGWPSPLMCFNSVQDPGRPVEVGPRSTCRNFHARVEPAVRTVPPPPGDERLRYIGLTQGRYAIVDTADHPWLNRWKWCAARTGNLWYAYRKHFGRTVRMHQLIAEPPEGRVVDHINGNGLDNRRANLRICTQRENMWNHGRRKPKDASSKYIGVYRSRTSPKKYHVRVTRDGKATNLGPFDSEIQAARARDRIARRLHGPFAYLNFPEEPQTPEP